jgi:sRNA-binding protein
MVTTKIQSAETIAELAKLCPAAFSTDPSLVRPLAVGVKEMLLERYSLSPEAIDGALKYYTGSTHYLNVVVEGAARVDLDGQSVGTVTMRQAEHAQRRLVKMAERTAAKPKPDASASTVKPKSDAAPVKSRSDVAVAVRRPGRATNDPVGERTAATRKSAATRTGESSQSGPPRLSLSDLKQAAAQRRKAVGF